jgi:hypothetical protein
MLNDIQKQLIAAAVDSDLDPRQDAEFRQLLAGSVDAATLYRCLLADQELLRSIRRIPAPPGLAETIRERTHPMHVGPDRAALARPAGWVPYVIAATVFLAVSIGSFWFSLLTSQTGSTEQAGRPVQPDTSRNPPVPTSRELAVNRGPESLPPPRKSVPSRIPDDGALAHRGPVLPTIEPAPLPRTTSTADVVGSRPAPDTPLLHPTEVRLPILTGVTDLDRPDIKARLLEDLTGEPAHRLDLFARDPIRAAELFRAAARSAGLTLSVDTIAQERMKRKLPSTWLVYTEALTAEEIVKLLGHIAAAVRKEKPPVLVTSHLVPAQAAEARDLREFLGLDAGGWKRTKAAAPRSITAGTADQLTKNLTRKGPDKPAILVTYLPPSLRLPPLASKEVRTYLERRGERKPDAVPLLIVIRPTS